MTTPQPAIERRRHPRFETTKKRFSSMLVTARNGRNKKNKVQVLDLSRSGAKLTVRQAVTAGDTVALQLQQRRIDLDLSVDARVCWVRPNSKGSWYIGCEFKETLAPNLLNNLAATGYLERRMDRRESVKLSALRRSELSDDEATPVEIIDYSSGGMRITAGEPAEIGERLLLEFPQAEGKAARVPARAVWQSNVEDGFQIGCCFLGNDGSDMVRNLIHKRKKENDMKENTDRALRVAPWVFAGLCGVIAWFSFWGIFDM